MSNKRKPRNFSQKSTKQIETTSKYNVTGPKNTQHKKKLMLVAIGDALGHIGHAVAQVNISRRTHETWMIEDPEYKRGFEDHLDYIKDEFEVLLKKRAYANDTRAIMFFLKTKGKNRGYIETTHNIQEHSGEIKNPGIVVNLLPDPKHEKEERNKLPASVDQKANSEVPKPTVQQPKETNDTSQDPAK